MQLFKLLDIYLQITVLQGDIGKVSADAIVHPTNSTYHMGGEVGEIIFRRRDLFLSLFA